MSTVPTAWGALPADPRRVPGTVTLSVAVWIGAILAGAVEALLHLAMPDPPSADALAVRFGIYLVLTVLVVSLRTGRNGVRWAVALLLGGLGTLSLVVEPVEWLLGGGDPAVFLVVADGPTLAAAGLRTLHVLEVLVALVLMFHPASTAFFRRAGRDQAPTSGPRGRRTRRPSRRARTP